MHWLRPPLLQAALQRSCSSSAGRRRWPRRPPSRELLPPCCCHHPRLLIRACVRRAALPALRCLLLACGRPPPPPADAPSPPLRHAHACSGAASNLVFSPDCKQLLVVSGDGVSVLDAASRQQLARLEIPALMAAALSPKGTFLITFQRPSKDESGQGAPGLAWRGRAQTRGQRRRWLAQAGGGQAGAGAVAAT